MIHHRRIFALAFFRSLGQGTGWGITLAITLWWLRSRGYIH